MSAPARDAKRQAQLGPEHKHFRILEVREKGDDRVECLYCSHQMTAGATRMRLHLLKQRGVRAGCQPCTGEVPDAVLKEMQEAENSLQQSKKQKQKEQALDAATQHVTALSAASSSRQSTIMEGFKKADKSVVDASLATWAYAVGIPFHKLDSKYFKDFCRQVGSFGSSYAPPGHDRLREGLLDGACNSISLQLQPFMEGVRRSGCIITSDGWDSVNSKPLLNIMVVTLALLSATGPPSASSTTRTATGSSRSVLLGWCTCTPTCACWTRPQLSAMRSSSRRGSRRPRMRPRGQI